MSNQRFILFGLVLAALLGLGASYTTEYIGCYTDCNGGRDLPNMLFGGTDADAAERCPREAAAAGYHYYGLQFGGECWAGNSYGSQGSSRSCDTGCSDGVNTCGGACANSVYSIGSQCTPSSKPLETEKAPYLDGSASGFSNRMVNLVVRVNVDYVSPTFQFVGGDNACESYAAWDAESSFDTNCYKGYSRSTAWSTANPHCGLKRSQVASEIWFTGYLLARATQSVHLSDGSSYTRQLSNLLGYAIRFPSNVTATADTTFYNPYPYEHPTQINESVAAAGIYSWSATASPLGGEMVIVTHMPYPYFLRSGPTLDSPTDLISSVDSDPLSTSECTDSGSQCIQYWKINVAPLSQDDQTRCDFSGVYNLTFEPACFRSALGYKYTCTPAPFLVSARLVTSKYCPFLTPIAIGATGTLTTHSDAALTTAASTFELESTVYFKLVVEGDAEVDSVTIQQATLTLANSNSSALTMVSDGLPVSANPLENAAVTVTNSAQLSIRNTASLSFLLHYDFVPIPSRTSTLATLRIVAGVTFANTAESSRRLLTIERTISPETLKLGQSSRSESRKWKRSFAKLANKRLSNTMALPDGAALDLKLLQSDEPALRTETDFIIGTARFV